MVNCRHKHAEKGESGHSLTCNGRALSAGSCWIQRSEGEFRFKVIQHSWCVSRQQAKLLSDNGGMQSLQRSAVYFIIQSLFTSKQSLLHVCDNSKFRGYVLNLICELIKLWWAHLVFQLVILYFSGHKDTLTFMKMETTAMPWGLLAASV